MYRFVKYVRNDGKVLTPEGEVFAVSHFEEEDLRDMVVLSFPETMSHSASMNMAGRAEKLFNRRVLIVGHNIELMKVEKLSPEDAAEFLEKEAGLGE